MFIKKLTIFACALPLYAHAVDEQLCTEGLTVYFAGGMLSNDLKEENSQDELESSFNERIQGTELEGVVDYGVSKNPSEGVLDDFYEAVIQTANIESSEFWRLLGEMELMPETMREKYKVFAKKSEIKGIDDNLVTQNHIELYETELQERQKIIVVGHSQGNLFANQAYYGISSELRPALAVVSVATPSAVVAGGGTYTTIEEDIVIEYTPGAKPANVNNFFIVNNNDWSGHKFVSSYMASNRPAKTKILNDIFDSYKNLSLPETHLKKGAFTATLTWGSEPDLDLHVFEPNGTHVYYQNMQGVSGVLDRDDVSSEGPEHYTVPCENLETGTYQIGINYYEGDASETGKLTVKTKTEIITRSETFSEALGSAGNDAPSILFEVTVTEDEEGIHTYSIE